MTSLIVALLSAAQASPGMAGPKPDVVSIRQIPETHGPTYVPPSPIGSQANWFPPEAYPSQARRAGEQGRVSVRLDIDPTGKPVGCTVERSSGSAMLDQVTCDLAMTNGRFTPATDGGKRVASRFLIPNVLWRLDDPPPLDLSAGETTLFDNVIEVTVDPQGAAQGCRTVRAVPADKDPCAELQIGRKISRPLVVGGRPVGGRVTISGSMRIVPDPAPKP